MKPDFLFYLGIAWAAWCCMHSLLINRSVQDNTEKFFVRMGFPGFRYRLFYTIAACLSLLPLVVLTVMVRGEVVLVWRGLWHLLELVLAIGALGLFWCGSRQYNLHDMVYGRKTAAGKRDDVEFSRDGVHGVIRHPWYLGSLLFLWSWPVYHEATILSAVILSCYLLIGAFIEERRLVAEFGEKYRQYQQEVSMLIPWKWLSKRVSQKLKRRD
ncbi:methyltransferase family protein [Desulfosediminicola ganghwensis]|uniref:methyltransferase family protein n=1 Tax=Desulfosediminicola ganghwensis TaxID=2569540 RepID=UPI0010ACE219|nr:isoprenylcysteine carboxylmethyltransferase family protein [Desulfosediminicola ganghwensis]